MKGHGRDWKADAWRLLFEDWHATAAPKAHEFDAQGLASRFRAIAKMGTSRSHVFEALRTAIGQPVQDFSMHGLANMLWAIVEAGKVTQMPDAVDVRHIAGALEPEGTSHDALSSPPPCGHYGSKKFRAQWGRHQGTWRRCRETGTLAATCR